MTAIKINSNNIKVTKKIIADIFINKLSNQSFIKYLMGGVLC